MPPSLPLNHLRSDSLLGCSPSLERLRGYRSWGGLIRGQGQGWGPFPPTARSRDTKPDLSHTDLSHTELPMLSRPALEPLDLSLLDLGTGPSPRRFCGRNRSKPRLAGKLSGRLLRRRPRTRTCPALTRHHARSVARKRRRFEWEAEAGQTGKHRALRTVKMKESSSAASRATRRSGKRRLCPVPAARSYSPLFPRLDQAYHI